MRGISKAFGRAGERAMEAMLSDESEGREIISNEAAIPGCRAPRVLETAEEMLDQVPAGGGHCLEQADKGLG